MSFANNDEYGLCKECFKQHKFCTCQDSRSIHSINDEKDQTFTEHNPQCQSIGEQEQQQQQEQGGLEQAQGPQIQDQIQEGQRQGPQKQLQGDQTQGDQTQGPQTQGQTETQVQTSAQGQTENQNQTQGPQLQAQRHGDQTMENNQTISTPVDVEGVKVDLKCGDCKPTIIFAEDFFEEKKKRKDHHQGGDEMERCNCQSNNCPKDCDCCVQNLADLLRDVQNFESTITGTAAQAIDIYFSVVNGFTNNQITGQVISDVVDCSVLRFRTAGQVLPVPNTAVQLCDVAGICATDTDTTPEISNVYEFLLQRATTTSPEEEDCTCKNKKKSCICPCCAAGIGGELSCTAPYGILLNVRVQGQTSPLPLYVLAVKDCLAYFIDSLTTPTRICVFSLCAISGFTVGTQALG